MSMEYKCVNSMWCQKLRNQPTGTVLTDSNNFLHHVCHQAPSSCAHVWLSFFGFIPPSSLLQPDIQNVKCVIQPLLWKKNLQASRRYFNICLSISIITAPNHQIQSTGIYSTAVWCSPRQKKMCLWCTCFNGKDVIQTTWYERGRPQMSRTVLMSVSD